MQLFESIAAVPDDFGGAAVTIGKFDGVHGGHRAVLDRLCHIATERGLRSVVITFDRNPMSLLHPESCPAPLVSTQQKLERLSSTGVDATLILTFDRALSEVSAEGFIATVVAGALHTRVILVGADFRFGAGGVGDVALLRLLGVEHGFEVIVIDDVAIESGRRSSSTFARELLAAGHVAEAGRILTTPHTLRGIVVLGQQRGRELGFPTANLQREPEGFIPADGVYAAWLVVDGNRFASAVSIGNNPTFDGVPEKQVEAYALDQDFDIYSKRVEIEFVAFIRGMVKYSTVEALIAQMTHDVEQVRAIMGVTARSVAQ
ncbi:MAG: bifunctional riboflavin kinase/FAD synthetase [Rhodoglobus sp.]